MADLIFEDAVGSTCMSCPRGYDERRRSAERARFGSSGESHVDLGWSRRERMGDKAGDLSALSDLAHADEETLGMFARTEKDLALRASSSEQRDSHLRRCTAAYADAYRLTGGYWTGINAATLALISGDKAGAEVLAASVRAQSLRALEEEVVDDYWLLATLGEAALVLGEQEQAAEFYNWQTCNQAGEMRG